MLWNTAEWSKELRNGLHNKMHKYSSATLANTQVISLYLVFVISRKRAWAELQRRYWKIHGHFSSNISTEEPETNHIPIEHHKVEQSKEDDLEDPVQPPYEVPDPPGSVNSHNYQWIFNPGESTQGQSELNDQYQLIGANGTKQSF